MTYFTFPVAKLETWGGWTAPSKTLLAGSGVALSLEPLLGGHAPLVLDLNHWLLHRLAADNATGRADVNKLMVEQEMTVTGLDREAVLGLIRDRSERRYYPPGIDVPEEAPRGT